MKELECETSAEIAEAMNRYGVGVIRGCYDPETLTVIRREAEALLDDFVAQRDRLDAEPYDYSFVRDATITPHFIELYRYRGTEVLDIKKGRYDFSPLTGEHLPGIDGLAHEKIRQAVDALMPGDKVTCYYGLLPSAPGSAEGDWHRDALPIDDGWFKTPEDYGEAEEAADLARQNYYFTILIPLSEANAANGSTAFKPGTHTMPARACHDMPEVQIDCELGDAVMFSGSVLHKGPRNASDETRMVLFLTFQDTEVFECAH